VAVLLPTPIPVSIALAASIPVTVLQNA
jgi:hypothetical protein